MVMLTHVFGITVILSSGVLVFGSRPFRGTCKREAIFKMVSNGSALTNHVISTTDVTTVHDCTLACLGHSQCVSYNFQITDSPTKKCELSDQTKVSKPSNYVSRPGYSYYDAADFVLPVCFSSPCQNGGSCVDVCKGTFVCKCLEDYIGDKCEHWIGHNGSSVAFPGRTCHFIRRYWNGLKSGKYWIHVKNTKKTLHVYCDMKTGGGGWMLIKNLTLPQEPNTVFHHPNYVELPTYEKLGALESYEWIHAAGLNALKNDLGFTQLRYYCYMASVGRVFHIMTNNDVNGHKALRFFVESSNPLVPPCQTFTAFPDDNSTLSRNCDKWGSTALDVLSNHWGIYLGGMRMYTGVAAMIGHSVEFGNSRRSCDGLKTALGTTGDTWKLFIR